MIDYLALEEKAFKDYCDTEEVLGDSMTQAVRDHMLDIVKGYMDERDKQSIDKLESLMSAVRAESEVINSIDLL